MRIFKKIPGAWGSHPAPPKVTLAKNNCQEVNQSRISRCGDDVPMFSTSFTTHCSQDRSLLCLQFALFGLSLGFASS